MKPDKKKLMMERMLDSFRSLVNETAYSVSLHKEKV